MNLNNWQIQVRKGLLEIAILNLLRHGRFHGYQMVQILKGQHGLKIREGNIYPILARLSAEGLVKNKIKPSEDGPPRKYFELTKAAQKPPSKLSLMRVNSSWLLSPIAWKPLIPNRF